MKKLNILELFGGIGAPRKALENLGFNVKVIDYVEIFPRAVEAYNLLFPHEHKPQDALDWNINVDLLIHGSPCQDFSIAGKNDMETGRSILYLRTLDIISNLSPRPKYVVWENVKSLISKNNIEYFNHYLKAMEELGYTNYWRVLNSLDFGVPQQRERVFVVSIRNDVENNFDFDNLEMVKATAIKNFLEGINFVGDKIIAPSMLRAIENGRVMIIDTYSRTITTKQRRWNNAGVWKKEDGFYYLSPCACWLLMGFSIEDFEKVKHLSERTLYSLSGNSIVVPVLQAIFKELLEG